MSRIEWFIALVAAATLLITMLAVFPKAFLAILLFGPILAVVLWVLWQVAGDLSDE